MFHSIDHQIMELNRCLTYVIHGHLNNPNLPDCLANVPELNALTLEIVVTPPSSSSASPMQESIVVEEKVLEQVSSEEPFEFASVGQFQTITEADFYYNLQKFPSLSKETYMDEQSRLSNRSLNLNSFETVAQSNFTYINQLNHLEKLQLMESCTQIHMQKLSLIQ